MAYQGFQAININVEDGVCVITLNKPEVRNALGEELREELKVCIQKISEDSGIRAIVLTGKDGVFSSGGDLKALQNISSQDVKERLEQSQDLIKSILTLNKPVIAAVEGFAAGAGFSLALACDVIYASETSCFIQSFIKIGAIPDLGSLYFLPALVGRQRAIELMLLGSKINSDVMMEYGIVNRVVKDEKVLEEAINTAKKLATNPSISSGFIKNITNRRVLMELEELFELEKHAQGVCVESDEFAEGVNSFFEKRKPVYH